MWAVSLLALEISLLQSSVSVVTALYCSLLLLGVGNIKSLFLCQATEYKTINDCRRDGNSTPEETIRDNEYGVLLLWEWTGKVMERIYGHSI